MNAYPMAGACWPAALLILVICRVWQPKLKALGALRALAQAVAFLLLAPIAWTLITT